MKMRNLAIALTLWAMLAAGAFASNYDMRLGGLTSRMPARIGVVSRSLDMSQIPVGVSSTTQLLTIPAGATVLDVQLKVDVAPTTATTFDVGDSADADGYLDGVSNATAATVFNSFHACSLRAVKTLIFGDIAVAASQSAAAWGTDTETDVGGVVKGYVVPLAGYVKAITAYTDDACTSGTLDADATINGTVTGLQANLDSVTNTTKDTTSQGFGLDPVAAGDIIGVKVTTSSTWAPTSGNGVVVAVDVVQDDLTTTAYAYGKYYSAANYIVLKAVGACTTGKLTVSAVYLNP